MLDTKLKPTTKATKLSMFLLAFSPISFYYAIGESPFNYFHLSGLIVFLLSFLNGRLNVTLPKTYIFYWIWCALQIYFIVGVHGWTDYLPGGVFLCMFGISLLGYVAMFNFDYLYKYMKWIFIVASILYLIQFFYHLGTGTRLSFFLPLGYKTTYSGLSYSELIAIHEAGYGEILERFPSIFAEPSYFGQYLVLFLGIELFKGGNKSLLYTKFSLYIILMLVLLRSGAGFIGLLVLGTVKCIYIAVTTNNKKYYFYVVASIIIAILLTYTLIASDFGSYLSIRASELDANSDDSSIRLFFGWNQLGLWDWKNIILGGGRNIAANYTENEWGSHQFINTAVVVIMYQGVIGAVLLLLSYVRNCRKNGILPIVLSIALLVFSFIENFLYGGIMTIVTSIVFYISYYNKHSNYS
ncbi:hypothetical protein [Bacteroides graminisolvens]|uniref:hypothetical protein n=1 Tax=Bacteroides graminisolvens TaxID=477666 RepID=UPI0023EF94CE|nr:hypothetical protein [Bacteroides graminisolvens]